MRTQLHHLVEVTAGRSPAAPALTSGAFTLNYAQLWERSRSFGRGLRDLGLRRGERVAIYLDKRPETVVAIFGTSVAGGVSVPVNPLLRPRQVGHIVDDCAVRILITTAQRLDVLRSELAICKSLEFVLLVGGETTPEPTEWDVREWPDGAASDVLVAGPAVDSDVAAIFYTSGSTGRPKGVVLSHRNLIVGAESVNQYLGNSDQDRILAVLPLSFDAGFSQLTTGCSAGAHVVLVNYLLPGDIVRLCAEHRITGLTCVPPLWVQLVDENWPDEATRSLRYFANTGGRMPRATLQHLRELFPSAAPYLMYGLTEAFRSTYLDPPEVDRRPDSIGKAIPNAEILVVREDGTPCEPGEPGELVHCGPLVSMGYWNDPERTAERFKPAPGRSAELPIPEMAVWSGDLAVSDAEGFLYFVDRKDEMIKISGYRVSPTEIEEVVYETGLVGEAVALGIADPRVGQRIALVVSPRNGIPLDQGALIAKLRRQLPLYMVPQQVVVRPIVPRSPNGKFDRAVLRGEFSAPEAT